MKKIFCIVLALFCSMTLFAKDKTIYVKKNGKYYKVKKKKRVKSKIRRSINSKVVKKIKKSEEDKHKILVAVGLAMGGSENESNSVDNNDDSSDLNYGYDFEVGYRFDIDERIKITPGLFLRKISYTKGLDETINNRSVNADASSFDIGMTGTFGYDFFLDNSNAIRPIAILGLSRGRNKAESTFSGLKATTQFDYTRIQYGFGVQGIMANGLTPFAKLTFSSLQGDSETTLEDGNGAAQAASVIDLEKDNNTVVVIGLGYWF